jgi:hypothetical protein
VPSRSVRASESCGDRALEGLHCLVGARDAGDAPVALRQVLADRAAEVSRAEDEGGA